MSRPRLITIVSAALSSLVAFFIITRSGLAGTLAGAAVAAIVSTATAHWSGEGLEHLGRRVKRPRNKEEKPGQEATQEISQGAGQETSLTTARLAEPEAEEDKRANESPWRRRHWLPLWISLVLVALALGATTYTVVSGKPIEQVIVRERVIEQPAGQGTGTTDGSPSQQARSSGGASGGSQETQAPVTTTTNPSGASGATSTTSSTTRPGASTTTTLRGSSSTTTTSSASP